jgi:hypothetical protein
MAHGHMGVQCALPAYGAGRAPYHRAMHSSTAGASSQLTGMQGASGHHKSPKWSQHRAATHRHMTVCLLDALRCSLPMQSRHRD